MKYTVTTAITICAGIAMLAALLLVFLYAPVDANMGIVQKIFYFHVSSAYTMYLSWFVCTMASIVYLAKRTDSSDMVAKSAGELALVFAVIVMITGPLWGRKSWGSFWTWDPRLTSTLLLALIIVAYVLLRYLASGEVERRFAAALAIMGACVVPLIHMSVYKWRGQHPTVITKKGGGLDQDMWITFTVSLVAFSLFLVALLLRRYGLEKNRRRLMELTEEAVTQGVHGEANR